VTGWTFALLAYLAAAVGTFGPVYRILRRKVELHPGGPSFSESPHFSEHGKLLLAQNFERLRGTLGFWKTQAQRYKAFHTYSLIWVTVSTVTVPFLAQAISDDVWSKWSVSTVGAHAALLLALSRSFRVESNYKAFRQGESDFYDLNRRLLDRPQRFGTTEDDQIAAYLEQVDIIRRIVRSAETDNLPSIEEVSKSRPSGSET